MLTFDVNSYLEEVKQVLHRADEIESKTNKLTTVAEDADRGGADDTDVMLGTCLEGEAQGDANWRTLQSLLKMVDSRGYERSAHQLKFHQAFEKSAARIVYRDTWSTSKPDIMRKHGWDKVSSEVMISTPRYFMRIRTVMLRSSFYLVFLRISISFPGDLAKPLGAPHKEALTKGYAPVKACRAQHCHLCRMFSSNLQGRDCHLLAGSARLA